VPFYTGHPSASNPGLRVGRCERGPVSNLVERIRAFWQLDHGRILFVALLSSPRTFTCPDKQIQRTDDVSTVFVHEHEPPTEVLSRPRSSLRIYRNRGLSHLWLGVATESPTHICRVSKYYTLETFDVVRGFGRRRELNAKLGIITCGVEDEAVRSARQMAEWIR
jgi:hypothetical protein